MKIVLVNLGPTFPIPAEISNLIGWEGLETCTETKGPNGVLGWGIAVSILKTTVNLMRNEIRFQTPLLARTKEELQVKLNAISGDEGQFAFWSKTPDIAFRYRWISIFADNGISMALLVEIPDVEGGLCVLAHIRSIN